MADVGKLSASKITTYKGCSLAYYLRYIRHEKISTNVRLMFGKNIHYMLEQFYKKKFKCDESFGKYWKFYWTGTIAGDFLKGKEKKELKVREYPYFIRDKETGKRIEKILLVGSHVDLGTEPVGVFFGYSKLGVNILERFYDRHIVEKNPDNEERQIPIGIEKSFGVKNDEPFDINGHPVRGVFDRIDKTKKGHYITDYKTDKSSPGKDSFTLHRHPQFTLYSYAFRKLFGRMERAILFYHLRSGKIFKTHRSEKDYDYLKKLLDEVAEGITKDKFVPFYGFHCNFCDYKAVCEKYSIPYRGGPRIDQKGKIKPAKEFTDWDVEVPDWIGIDAEER